MNDQHYDPFTEKKKGLFHRNEEAAETKENNAKAMAEALNENLQNEPSDVHADDEANIQREAKEAPKAEALSMGEESKTATEGVAQGFEATQAHNPKPPRRRYSHPVSAMVVAGFWIRTVAFLIDAAVASAFAALFASPINALLLTEGGLAAKAIIGFFFYLYFILSTYFTNGQSLGKIITAIRVIHPEEDRLSLTTVVIREGFCRLIQTTFVLLYVITAFSERKRNLGDYLSDTYVVKDALYLVEKKEGDLFYAYEN